MPESPQFPSFNVIAFGLTPIPEGGHRVRLHTKQTEPFDIVLPPWMARELSDKLRERIVSVAVLLSKVKPPRYLRPHQRTQELYGQILARIEEVGAAANTAEICRTFGVSPRAFYVWRHHHKHNGVKA
jgi:hypothetical protein